MRPRFPLALLASASLVLTLAGCAPAATTSANVGRPLHGDVSSPDGSGHADSDADRLGVADGYIPDGETVALSDDVPAVAKLRPGLRDALVRASEAAAERDVVFTLTDGWRSERYQEFLFARAVTKYGSEAEASKWVKRGDASKHVRGEAVDIATADAMDWLSRFGGEFGLCRIYANEAWHFELAADASGVCPEQLPDGSAG
ncbi:M15 family metallopeptidase [Leifsonia sp. NPDC058292]|uniref:M15 family metallopeptidase n=1 Tax=Leifsonia sp. NPDC058292 TaxID=3346428 RepID=UPI0036D763BC